MLDVVMWLLVVGVCAVLVGGWVLIIVVSIVNSFRGIKYDNSEIMAKRYPRSAALEMPSTGPSWRAIAIQAAFIIPWPVMAIYDGQTPGMVLTVAFIVTLMVWFIGAVLANLADWLRLRFFSRSASLSAIKGRSVVGNHTHEASAKGGSLGGKPVLLGEPLEDVRRLAIGEKPRDGL